MPTDNDPSKPMLDEYNQYTSHCLNDMSAATTARQKFIDDIRHDIEESVTIFDQKLEQLQSLKQYSENLKSVTNYRWIKEELTKIVAERKTSLEKIIHLKRDKKATMASYNQEIKQINEEMDRLDGENSRITEILNSKTDNLICRLMKSSD